ncbi:hypothetical protein VPH35_083379 [Triticum aestivum]
MGQTNFCPDPVRADVVSQDPGSTRPEDAVMVCWLLTLRMQNSGSTWSTPVATAAVAVVFLAEGPPWSCFSAANLLFRCFPGENLWSGLPDRVAVVSLASFPSWRRHLGDTNFG